MSMQQVQYLAGDVLASVGVLDDNPCAGRRGDRVVTAADV
jgi:hypothetical protein